MKNAMFISQTTKQTQKQALQSESNVIQDVANAGHPYVQDKYFSSNDI